MQTNKANWTDWLDVWAKLLYGFNARWWWRWRWRWWTRSKGSHAHCSQDFFKMDLVPSLLPPSCTSSRALYQPTIRLEHVNSSILYDCFGLSLRVFIIRCRSKTHVSTFCSQSQKRGATILSHRSTQIVKLSRLFLFLFFFLQEKAHYVWKVWTNGESLCVHITALLWLVDSRRFRDTSRR